MKRTLFVSFIVVAVSFAWVYSLMPVAGNAQSMPASKVAVQTGDIRVSDALLGEGRSAGGWESILSCALKTSQQKDLFIDVSAEIGLYTRTLAKGKNGDPDGASATAGVQFRVLVDAGGDNERMAYPGNVVFGRRTQTLTAIFQGLLEGCMTVDGEGNVIIDEECVQPEELELVLKTMNANAFSFVLDDLGSGVHSVEVQARIVLANELLGTQSGEVEAKALIGKGTMTVQEVRLVKGVNVILD